MKSKRTLFCNIAFETSERSPAVYLRRVGDGEADTQIVDGQLQEEGAEGLDGGLLDARQLVHHLLGGHMDVLVEGQALLVPVVVRCLVIQPEEHSCGTKGGGMGAMKVTSMPDFMCLLQDNLILAVPKDHN